MSNYCRKLRRIAQRRQAREECKLWTPEDWTLYISERKRLLADGVGNEAASRRAYMKTRARALAE